MKLRFDDICGNTDMVTLRAMINALDRWRSGTEVLLAVSPIWYRDAEAGYVFDRIAAAKSDPAEFYRGVQRAELPDFTGVYGKLCSHGLVHVDHRFLDATAQEMSIVVSCSILGASTFVPPFNKWNADTEAVCAKHGIELVRFEDGWLSAEYNAYNPEHENWYLHPRNWTVETLLKWLNRS